MLNRSSPSASAAQFEVATTPAANSVRNVKSKSGTKVRLLAPLGFRGSCQSHHGISSHLLHCGGRHRANTCWRLAWRVAVLSCRNALAREPVVLRPTGLVLFSG